MTAHDSNTLHTARLPWWLVLIPGFTGILFGVLLLGSPGGSLTRVVQYLGIYWFIFGALAAFSLTHEVDQSMWKMVSTGLSLLAGLLVLLNFLISGFFTEPVLAVVLGLTGALIGLLGLVQALRGEGIVSGVLGGMNLLLGVLLLFQPQAGSWPLAWLLGSLLLFGSLLAIFAALARSMLGASYPSASRQVSYAAAPDVLEAEAPSAAREIDDLDLETATAPAAWELPLRYEPPAPPLDEDVDAIAKAEAEEKSSLWSSPETEKAFEHMQYEQHTAIPLGTPPSGEDIGELEEDTLGLDLEPPAELEVPPEIELPFEGAGAEAEFEAPPEPPLRAASVLESLPSLEEIEVEALPALDVNVDAELEAPPELEDAAPAPQVEELPPAPEVAAIQPEPLAAPAAASEEDAAQAELMTKFRFPLEFVEGIGPAYAAALKNAGLHTCLDLLKAGTTRSGREQVSHKSGLPGALIMKWVNHVDLYRVRGIGSEYADLLEAAGVDTVAELAQRSPSHLYAALIEVYNEKQPVRQMPTQAQVEDWVRRAKRLPRAVEY